MTHSAPQSPQDRLIVALDFPDAASALALVDRLDSACRWVKVGLELFIAEGPQIISPLSARGLNVFLDLKLHDIPTTVAGAIRTASKAGAKLLTLHAGGGPAMLEAAATAAASLPNPPQLLAVTVLTSMDATQLRAVGVTDSPADQVARLASTAWITSMVRSLGAPVIEPAGEARSNADVFGALLRSDSLGRFVNERIKPRYPSVHVGQA